MAMLIALIKCRTGFEKAVKASLEKIPELIGRIDIITGKYDIIVSLKAETSNQLQSLVLGKLRNIPNVVQTVSLPVIEI